MGCKILTMKRILIFIFLVVGYLANGQTKPSYFTPIATPYDWNWGRFTRGVRVPLDTASSADVGSIAYKNGVFYGKQVTAWVALPGLSGGADSSIFATKAWSNSVFQPIGSYVTSSFLASNNYTKTQVNSFFGGTASISGYNKSNWDNVYSAYAAAQALSPAGWATQKALVDTASSLRSAIGSGGGGGGSGDMTKAVYDPGNDGTVDNSQALNGHADTYFQTALSGTGVLAFSGTTPAYIPGAANQLLRRNAANTAYEFFTPNYQATLVSGTNIKTINGNTLLGSGDLSISTQFDGTVAGLSLNTSTSMTLSNTAVMTVYSGSGNAVWTLPAIASTLTRTQWIKNGSASTLTVQRNGTDAMYDNGSVTSVVLQPGESKAFININSTWYTYFDSRDLASYATTENVLLKANNLSDVGSASTARSNISAEQTFTETTQEFTSSTSMSITLSNTPKAGKAEMYYLNGIVIKSSNISRTGTGVTLSGFTRESSDVITAKYSY